MHFLLQDDSFRVDCLCALMYVVPCLLVSVTPCGWARQSSHVLNAWECARYLDHIMVGAYAVYHVSA